MKKRLLLFVPLVVFLVIGIFLYRGLFLNPKKLESALEGKPIPVFQLERLEKASDIITNDSLKGKVSMLNVWATWCPSCRYEHPYLMQLAKQNILPIYGINYRDDRAAAIRELSTLGDPYTQNIYDHNGRLGLDLGVYGAPESFLVDHNGIIRFRYAGPINTKVWNEILYPLVKELQAQAKTQGAS